MQTIGLIGGMSWESSAEYYRIINQETNRRLGGVHSAQCLMCSVDFEEIKRLQHEGDWEQARRGDEGRRDPRWSAAGPTSSCCAPTPCIASPMRSRQPSSIPLLHIADPTAERIKAAGFQRVGLLGTAFTMEQDFYKGRLQQRHGLDVIVPDEDDRRIVHEIIYKELVLGTDQAGIAAGLSRDHRAPDRARRSRRHPRLHRDHAAGVRRGQRRAAVRHDDDPCAGGGRRGVEGGLRHALCHPRREAREGIHAGCLDPSSADAPAGNDMRHSMHGRPIRTSKSEALQPGSPARRR